MELKINKTFRDLIPNLSKEEIEELEKSILSDGIREPICVWNGTIVDGHHRYNIAKKHDLLFKVEEMEFLNEDDVKVWIISNQLSRRNISPFVRAELEIERERIHKLRAQQLNEIIGRKNLTGDFSGAEELEIKKTDTREEVAKAAGVSHGYIFNVKQIKNKCNDEEVLQKLRENKVTVSKVLNEIKKAEKKTKREEEMKLISKTYKKEKDIQIINADFYSWCNENLEDNSIDLILTDPPYPKEFLHLWPQLAEVAARVLKEGAYLATYSGQLYLDHVMVSLGQQLSYCWTVALFHTGATQLVHPRKVIGTWKPILIYRKGDPGKFDEAFVDSFMDDYRDKDFHEWGQGESAVGYLMKSLSKPGDLVLEPFAGGGTTLVVAKDLMRKCIGIEIDSQYIDVIKSNLLKPKTVKII